MTRNMVRLAYLIVGVLAGGCGQTQTAHPAGTSGSGDLAQAPRQRRSNNTASYDGSDDTPAKGTTMLTTAADVFDYAVGNPHFHGRSTLHITGDGAATVTFEQSGKTQDYKGKVAAKQLDALRASLAAHPIDSYKFPKRPLVPDEATMDFSLVNAGARTHNSIPDNERWESEPLGELVTLINEIMGSLSGGKVRY
jgi:hypothetical protein